MARKAKWHLIVNTDFLVWEIPYAVNSVTGLYNYLNLKFLIILKIMFYNIVDKNDKTRIGKFHKDIYSKIGIMFCY